MARLYELTDAQRRRIEDLLPCKKSDAGLTGADNRLFVNAVFWMLRYPCEGVWLSPSTLADQFGHCAVALAPLARCFRRRVMGVSTLHGEDATVPVPAKGKTDVARTWVCFNACASPAWEHNRTPCSRKDTKSFNPVDFIERAAFAGFLSTKSVNYVACLVRRNPGCRIALSLLLTCSGVRLCSSGRRCKPP